MNFRASNTEVSSPGSVMPIATGELSPASFFPTSSLKNAIRAKTAKPTFSPYPYSRQLSRPTERLPHCMRLKHTA